jgi:hypothetical protein
MRKDCVTNNLSAGTSRSKCAKPKWLLSEVFTKGAESSQGDGRCDAVQCPSAAKA